MEEEGMDMEGKEGGISKDERERSCRTSRMEEIKTGKQSSEEKHM